jgi:hypothetical protein
MLMNSLFSKAQEKLRARWTGRNGTDFSGRPGKKSVMVRTLVAETWSCEEIMKILQAEIPDLEKLAKEVVAELKAEIARD